MYPTASPEHVWVVDAHGDPGIHIFDAESGELSMSFGRRGDGPTEFGQVPFGLVPHGLEAVMAWDPMNQRLLGFQPRHLTDYEPTSITLEYEGLVTHVVGLGSRLIGQTSDLGARFVVFDSSGAIISVSAEPFYGDSLTAPGDRVQATISLSSLCSWPDRGFAVVNAMFGEIQLFDRDARFVRTVDVPDPSGPLFTVDATPRRFEWPDNFHYVSCAVADDQLYALYSGHPLGDEVDLDAAAHGSTVHRFDWQGRATLQADLGRRVRSLGFDPFRNRLLASSLEDATISSIQLDAIR